MTRSVLGPSTSSRRETTPYFSDRQAFVGRRVKKRGRHKKLALRWVVSSVRKLALAPHEMPITGEPFRWPRRKEA